MEEKEDKIKNDTDLERTEILYGSDNIVKRTIGDFHKIQETLDNCTDSTGPSSFSILQYGRNLLSERIEA